MSEVGSTVRAVAEGFQRLKALFELRNDEACLDILDDLKRKLIMFPTFLQPTEQCPTRAEELTLTREVLEHAVLVSARRKDLDSFELYFNQLNVYYTDISTSELPESPLYLHILGLNLIRLLVRNRIAQFHSELEKIPNEIHGKSAYIRFAVLLERCLMEGSYNKLLNSRHQAPSNDYVPVVEMLETTVRQEVAECIPRSYTTLSFDKAQKILMVDSVEDVQRIGQRHNWGLGADGRSFVFTKEEDLAKKEVPFQDMLRHHLNFAAELQRIV
ncbi:putative CSN8 PSMD8 EIF3K family [Trypanosoma vivax]|uniref:Proteasome regulatory non-ATP-ase subunit, putative n=1 Tax=Trypanosoma vivax (strain Y486) TaxID=1055687 RepID=F9WVP4_TRYVY|nr:putative proteasome regulatory non-ATP-ase subunit [Trypanosoma vivax]KAH8603554.1 putative CSN8 PSMD8 EIF3K family [Trypanosoma vivax]CCD21652.1 proteasome regulatory non-ATP-ase subunit, putative [Trypanosoma vivax Y486]|eukprot:CCD21652.1 proteasome regulatory non-ATP-ase subunit, putative [Trypanosoma vivax Y486]